MEEASTVGPATDGKSSKRNWWKIGFFIAVFAFELMRELFVIQAAEGARPNAMAIVHGDDDYAEAQGSWMRLDGGSALVPGVVRISCRAATAECVEVSVTVNERYVHAPDISRFAATFGPGTVSYTNDVPDCATYTVRIDLKMEKAFAVRQKRPDASGPCALLERRIEMQLVDGHALSENIDPLEGHFVPIVRLVRSAFDAFQ